MFRPIQFSRYFCADSFSISSIFTFHIYNIWSLNLCSNIPKMDKCENIGKMANTSTNEANPMPDTIFSNVASTNTDSKTNNEGVSETHLPGYWGKGEQRYSTRASSER